MHADNLFACFLRGIGDRRSFKSEPQGALGLSRPTGRGPPFRCPCGPRAFFAGCHAQRLSVGMSSELRRTGVAAELAAAIRESCTVMDEHLNAFATGASCEVPPHPQPLSLEGRGENELWGTRAILGRCSRRVGLGGGTCDHADGRPATGRSHVNALSGCRTLDALASALGNLGGQILRKARGLFRRRRGPLRARSGRRPCVARPAW
jgi:hypothetical protein